MNNRSRLPIVGLLIVSLLAVGLTRHWASVARTSGTGAAHTTGGSGGLSRMNSFALALLLGGLRGPLVMFLWPSAEAQKQEKNLEDFDTKIELIRLLQAEFDSVHIFQIWNKAYNISVQMANLGNKYRTILDALDYAHSVDAERPNNINILTAIGQIHFDKLANSQEKNYYRERIRDESMARTDLVRVTVPESRRAELTNLALDAGVPARKLQFSVDDKAGTAAVTLPKTAAEQIQPKLSGQDVQFVDRPRARIKRDDPTWKRTELDPLLDAKGNILPEYLVERNPRPADLPADSEWMDGSELQYLKKYEPYPYGVSPWAMGYNYYKRAQVLQSVNKQQHAQLSDLVVDSRPALSLKNWSEEEWERALRAEAEGLGKTIPVSAERWSMVRESMELKLDTPVLRRPPIDEAIFSFGRAAQLTADAIAEYERHLANDKTNITTYLSHMDELNAEREMMLADRDFLVALTDPAKRAESLSSAARHYREALRRYQIILLQYYVTDALAQQLYPPGVTKANIAKMTLSPDELKRLVAQARQTVPQDTTQYEHGDEFREFMSYIRRAETRLATIGA